MTEKEFNEALDNALAKPRLPDAYTPTQRTITATSRHYPKRVARVTRREDLTGLRKFAGLTQRELALFLGTTETTLSRLENGSMAIDDRWVSHLTLAFAHILKEVH